jgi:hypothetical protein
MRNQIQLSNQGTFVGTKITRRWPRSLVVGSALACLALSPVARAVSPPPDGGYPNLTTAEGEDALFSLTTGLSNTGLGWHALYSNTTGVNNTAVGDALRANTSGNNNTAVGESALAANTTASNNVGCGATALLNNTTGDSNVAIGVSALLHNTLGDANTALGQSTLQSNTTGGQNTAVGNGPLGNNTTGFYNTAVGAGALTGNTTGSHNIALGDFAGNALTTGNSNIDIGNDGVATDSGVIRIGEAGTQTATFIAGISETPISAGVRVAITPDGQLGVKASSARFKEGIKPMDKASEAILALKPVSFHYKKALDPKGLPQFGLVAEEVAKVDPDLVVTDAKGKPFTVRYDEVNAMLLNEFLKEHRKVEEQTATISEVKSATANQDAQITRLESTIAEEEKQIASLRESLKQQAAEVREVSARLERERSTPRLIADK